MMDEITTVQVRKSTAENLKQLGGTYDDAIRKVMRVPPISKTLTLRKTVPALTHVYEDIRVPVDGIITNVFMHFPPGANALVDVRLLYRVDGHEYYVVPSIDDKFIALDDFTPSFPTSFPVEEGKVLRGDWWNYDSANPHTIPIIVTIMSGL